MFDYGPGKPVELSHFDDLRTVVSQAQSLVGTNGAFGERLTLRDFFDGKRFVMKGGSARTAACMLRPTFRNWFQAHYQYVYAGFRCVRH